MSFTSNYTMSKQKIVVYVFAIYVFVLSMYVFTFAVNGDQFHYIKFYDVLPELSFLEAYTAQYNILGSAEPGYFIVTYLVSNILGLDRSLFFSILNAMLAYLVGFWMAKNRVSIFVFLLIAVNFYLMVLFFSADRLKLAVLFFVFYLSSTHKLKVFVFLISLLTHIQLSVFLISKFIHNFFLSLRGFSRQRLNKEGQYSFLFILLGVLVLFLLHEHLIGKIAAYFNSPDFLGLLKVVFFMTLSVFYAKNKIFEIATLFFPILIFTFFLGGERFVVFGYFIFMFYGLQINKGLNFGVLTVTLYFSLKGLFFLQNIFLYGDGFNAASL